MSISDDSSWVEVTASAVLRLLGDHVLAPLRLGEGADTVVSRIVTAEPLDPPALVRGALVLAVGFAPDEERFHALLEHAERAGCAAVIVRDVGGERPREFPTALTVLGLRRGVDWADVQTTVAAIGTLRPGEVDLAANNESLFSLANSIATRVGGAVSIEDLGMRVLAYSTVPGQAIDALRREAILNRRVPDHDSNQRDYRAVLREATPVWSQEPPGSYPRLAVAIRAGAEPLGTIWVVQGDTPLDESAPEALMELAELAAVQLARLRLDRDDTRRTHHRLVARLLEDGSAAQASARDLGLPADVETVGLVLGVPRGQPDEISLGRAAERVSTYLVSQQIRAAVAPLDGVLVALAFGSDLAEPLLRAAGEMLPHLTRVFPGQWQGVLGEQQSTLRGLGESVRRARAALDTSGPAPEGSAIRRYAECESGLFFAGLGRLLRDHLDELPDGRLTRIIEHDRAKSTDYIATLAAWCGTGFDVPAAAAELFTHPNTLRYRLSRIAEVFDVPIHDPDWRLWTAVLLRTSIVSREGAS